MNFPKEDEGNLSEKRGLKRCMKLHSMKHFIVFIEI